MSGAIDDLSWLKEFETILDVFGIDYFSNKENGSHPLFMMIKKRTKLIMNDISNIESLLKFISSRYGISNKTRKKLRNLCQFYDTLFELMVLKLLLENGIDKDFIEMNENEFPDIVINIPDIPTVNIEIKNMNIGEKLYEELNNGATWLADSPDVIRKGEVPPVEIYRIVKRYYEEINDKFSENKYNGDINIVIFGLPLTANDEYFLDFQEYAKSYYPDEDVTKNLSAIVAIQTDGVTEITRIFGFVVNEYDIPDKIRNIFNIR